MKRLLTVVTTVAILLVATAAFGTVFLYEDFETMPADWYQDGTDLLWHLDS